MKYNKSLLLSLFMSLAAGNLHAGIADNFEGRSIGNSGNPGSSSNNAGGLNSVSEAEGSSSSLTSCSIKNDDGTLSPNFLSNVLNFSERINFNNTGKNAKMKFSNFLNVSKCLDLETKVLKDASNNQIIRFKNKKDFSPKYLEENTGFSDLGFVTDDEIEAGKETEPPVTRKGLFKKAVDKLGAEDKLLLCMMNNYPKYFAKNANDNKRNPSKFDHNIASASSSAVSINLKAHSTTDTAKTSKFYFSRHDQSTGTGKYPKSEKGDFALSGARAACYNYVEIEDGKTFYAYKSTIDSVLEGAHSACLRNDIFAFRQERARLPGNATSLMSYLDKISLNMIDRNAKELMEKWESLSSTLQEKGQAILDADEDAEDLPDLAYKFRDTLNDIDDEIIAPSAKILVELEDMYNKLGKSKSEKKEKEKIADKMASIRKIVGGLNEEGLVTITKEEVAGDIIDKIKARVGVRVGRSITETFLKSREFGKVCKSKCPRSKLTVKQAISNFKTRMSRFENNDKGDWILHRAAYNGSSEPMNIINKKIAYGRRELAEERYSYKFDYERLKRENELYNKYCRQGYNRADCIIVKSILQNEKKKFSNYVGRKSNRLRALGAQYSSLSSTYEASRRRREPSENYKSGSFNLDRFFDYGNTDLNLNPDLLYNMHGEKNDPMLLNQQYLGAAQQDQLRRLQFQPPQLRPPQLQQNNLWNQGFRNP